MHKEKIILHALRKLLHYEVLQKFVPVRVIQILRKHQFRYINDSWLVCVLGWSAYFAG